MPMHCYLWTNDSQTGAEERENITPVVVVYWHGSTSPEDLADQAYADAEALGRPTRIAILHRKLLEEAYTGYDSLHECDITTAYTRGLEIGKWQDAMTRFRVQWKANGPLLPKIEYVDLEGYQNGINFAWHIYWSGANWTDRSAALAKILDDDKIRPLLPPSIQKFRSTDFSSGYGSQNSTKHKALQDLEYKIAKNNLCRAVREVMGTTWSRIMDAPLPIMLNYDCVIQDREFYDVFGVYTPKMAISVKGVSSPVSYQLTNLAGSGIYTGLSKNARYNSTLYAINAVIACSPKQVIMPWQTHPMHTGTYSNPPTNTIPIVAAARTGHLVLCNAHAALGISEVMGWAPGVTSGQIDDWNTNLASVTPTNPPTKRPQFIAMDAASFQIGGYSYTYNSSDWTYS